MLSRAMIALALLAVTSAGWAAMSECQADCEKTYKYCVDKRSKSESACRVDYEKCRKACAKKEGKPSPG